MFPQGFSCPVVLWILPCCFRLRIRGFHPLLPVFPVPFSCPLLSLVQSEPRCARTAVWALPVPLAATPGITFVFSSSGYLDVSVHRVPLHALWIHAWIHGVCPCGFPHSEIRGSQDICSSPRLFAAYHVFLRLSVPRHPPCALFSLTLLFPLAFPRIALRLPAFFLFFVQEASLPAGLFSPAWYRYLCLFDNFTSDVFSLFFGSSVFGFQGTMSNNDF